MQVPLCIMAGNKRLSDTLAENSKVYLVCQLQEMTVNVQDQKHCGGFGGFL